MNYNTNKAKGKNTHKAGKKEKFILIGSSNFFKIQEICENPHHIFKKINFQNFSARGLTANEYEKKFFIDFFDFEKFPKNAFLILSIGTNHFQNDKFSLYSMSFLTSIFKLLQLGIEPSKIIVLGPFVRGHCKVTYDSQNESVDCLVIQLKRLGILAVNPFHQIDYKILISRNELFGKSKDGVHFSKKVRILLFEIIGNLIERKVDTLK